MKKYVLSLFVLQSLILMGFSSHVLAHTDITVPDANDMINSGIELKVLDVREPSEYCGSMGYVPGALNYPWNSGYLQAHYADFSIDEVLLIICHSGNRSNVSATFLDGEGYSQVYDILGGTLAWKNTYKYNTADCVDSDSDGFNDDLDNCPDDYNPSQTDSDGDGKGNSCDGDCPDFDGLNPVDLSDLAILYSQWHLSGSGLVSDLSKDLTVNAEDLAILGMYWLSDCYED